jgi:hypothetical protein
MFGRYSLDAPGLILANQGETLADYLARVPEPTFMPDAHNVIPVLDGDWFADDITERFRKFLRLTFGEAKFPGKPALHRGRAGQGHPQVLHPRFLQRPREALQEAPDLLDVRQPQGQLQALIYMHRYRPDTVERGAERLPARVATVKQIAELEEWEREVVFPLRGRCSGRRDQAGDRE